MIGVAGKSNCIVAIVIKGDYPLANENTPLSNQLEGFPLLRDDAT